MKRYLKEKSLVVFVYFFAAVFFAGTYASIETQPYMQGLPGLGTETHDDLVDGLCYLVIGLVEAGLHPPKIWSIDIG